MIRIDVRIATGAVLVLVLSGCEPSREALVTENASVISGYCLDCHNEIEQVAEFSLERLDIGAVHEDREAWERVVRKLRGGMMPPADGPRPDPETYASLTTFIEAELDAVYEPELPPPGMHRMNRSEYGNAIRDLLALDVDATDFLPPDDSSRGFDNQAGTLGLSPALLDAYLSAAGKIARLAIGDVSSPSQALYRVAEDTTQNYHVEGLPFGTRGGLLATHQFPVDGRYNIRIFSVNLGNMGNFSPFGEVRGEQLEVLIDGARVALVDWDEAFEIDRGFGAGDGQLMTIDVPVDVTAGPHDVGVTFLASNYAPLLDLNNAFDRSTIETGGLPGFTFYPHIGRIRIDGPQRIDGVSPTPSRDRIFVCTPGSEEEEPACAREIVESLARLAYRGTGTAEDVDTLLSFYELGRTEGDFEAGIEMALQRLLAEPKFLYRVESEPADLMPGEPYALSDLELASRLSFFLWSSIPDDELLSLAEAGRLHEPEVLEAQALRMIADPRSQALTRNFAGQWLALRSLDTHSPVVDQFPDFDDNLRQAFKRETELLFDSVLREDRSIVDLLTADYTFVNDRLASYYGIPGVQGSRFRRVELSGDLEVRRGLLGKGSVLTVSSQPGRTSPVIRGKWIMGTIIGVPAPDPPPDVPPLMAPEVDPAGNARQPTIRETMEAHRENPACAGCHKLMDPFGFALEPFDATGHWRETDNGTPIVAESQLYDGTVVNGPNDVREFLLKYKDQYVRNVAEKLLIYAMGRGVEYFDMPVVRSIVRDAEEHDYRFSAMVLAVIRSDPFQKSTKTGDAPTLAAVTDRSSTVRPIAE